MNEDFIMLYAHCQATNAMSSLDTPLHFHTHIPSIRFVEIATSIRQIATRSEQAHRDVSKDC